MKPLQSAPPKAGLPSAASRQPPEPRWLDTARTDIGLRELPGAPTAPRIAAWLQTLGAWWRDDETPWCGTAVAAWMRASRIAPPAAWYRALAWAAWGQPLAAPAVGCVVVFSRQGGGHVGLVTGLTAKGRLIVLGGNQGDRVGESSFDVERVVAYRWPPGEPSPGEKALAQGTAAQSIRES